MRPSSIESTSHFLLHCPIFHVKRHTFLSTLNNIDSKILEPNDSYLTQTLLFGSASFDSETNTLVLNAAADYILSTERFEEPVFLKNLVFSYAIYLILSDQLFFCIPKHFKFSVPGDYDFLVYCVILYINIFIYKKTFQITCLTGLWICLSICLFQFCQNPIYLLLTDFATTGNFAKISRK